MRWKQFFTPVQSLNAQEAQAFMEERASDQFTLLDVRQPGEYEGGHLPGATLIPLGDLGDRLGEIDPAKPTIVYCAIGGRSRMAAQMLAGKGFSTVYNLSGGIKAWHSNTAVGPVDAGMELFTGRESAAEALPIAYSLESGLQDFYLAMAAQSLEPQIGDLFHKLAQIETNHKDRLYEIYCSLTDNPLDRTAFESQAVAGMVEGGVTTQAYLAQFKADMNDPVDVISLAMTIEAQALDLYQRAAQNCADAKGQAAFRQIANEEKAHLKQLGRLLEQQ